MELFEHSVVDVCMALHSDAKGTGGGMSCADRAELTAWLQWRLDNWMYDRTTSQWESVDFAIRLLAIRVLEELALDNK